MVRLLPKRSFAAMADRCEEAGGRVASKTCELASSLCPSVRCVSIHGSRKHGG